MIGPFHRIILSSKVYKYVRDELERFTESLICTTDHSAWSLTEVIFSENYSKILFYLVSWPEQEDGGLLLEFSQHTTNILLTRRYSYII